MDVRIRQDICEEEKSYIQKRLKIVGDCLRRHGIECKPDEIPRVALLASGGGERALIACLGILRQLGKEDLLDCFLYLAGVSGSAWAMASLYADAHWSKNSREATSNVLNSISEGKGVTFSEGVQWLKGRHKEGDLSLTDPWGVIVCDIKGVPLETRILSDEGSRDGVNPYPLYSAIDKALYDKWMNEKKVEIKEIDLWFELSPHEAGFTEPGAFIKTSLLKQNFEGGRVQYNPNRKPMDMVQLQGICSSVFGDLQCIWKWIKKYLLGMQDDSTPVTGLQVVIALVELVECTHNEMKGSHEVLTRLKTLLREEHGKFSPTLLKLDFETWTNMRDQERKQHIQMTLEELIESSEQWGQDLNKLNSIADVWWVMRHILPLFFTWNFGAVANFLYQFSDPKVPEEMCQKDIMHLIDAGLFLDSPYPSMLRDGRDVDVIVSFDFSEDPFQTLYEAQEYAKITKKPFPQIDNLVNDIPESFYVFEKEGAPTVIHIPLFNKHNCQDITKEQAEYATFKLPYRDEKKINHLANLSAANMDCKNSKHLLDVIGKAAKRCKAK